MNILLVSKIEAFVSPTVRIKLKFFKVNSSLVSSFPKVNSNAYFDAQLDRVEQIFFNESYCDFAGIKVRKVNKTRVLVGDIKIFQDFGDDIIAETIAFVKQGGEYRLMPYKVGKIPFCQLLQKDVYFYKKLTEKSDFPEDIEKDCPIVQVSSIENFHLYEK